MPSSLIAEKFLDVNRIFFVFGESSLEPESKIKIVAFSTFLLSEVFFASHILTEFSSVLLSNAHNRPLAFVSAVGHQAEFLFFGGANFASEPFYFFFEESKWLSPTSFEVQIRSRRLYPSPLRSA